MFRKITASFLILSLSLFAPQISFAAAPADKSATNSSATPSHHLANIVFAGLAGAILGLSTLSFYGRPQDRLSNIAVGFAIGVIGGTIYTTYKAASEPKDFYGLLERDHTIPQLALEGVPVRGSVEPAPRGGWTFSF